MYNQYFPRPHLLELQSKTISRWTSKLLYPFPGSLSSRNTQRLSELLILARLSQLLCVSCCHHSEGKGIRCVPPAGLHNHWLLYGPTYTLPPASAPWKAESEASVATNGRIAWMHSWPLSSWGGEVEIWKELGVHIHLSSCEWAIHREHQFGCSSRGWLFPPALVQHCLWLREKFGLILGFEMNKPIQITDLRCITPFDSKKAGILAIVVILYITHNIIICCLSITKTRCVHHF